MTVKPEELAQSLMQRFRRQRAAEVARSRVLRDKLRALAPVITADASRRAWLIGSLAKGTWGEHSDVDLDAFLISAIAVTSRG